MRKPNKNTRLGLTLSNTCRRSTRGTSAIRLLTVIAVLLILAALLVVTSNRWLRGRQLTALAARDADSLQMKLAYSEGPIQLFVDRDFPEKTPLKLYDNNQQLLISRSNLDQNYQAYRIMEATLSLGADFEIKCYYTLEDSAGKDGYRYLDNGIQLLELRLQKGREILYDLNADGKYDLRYTCSDKDGGERSCEYAVWYENQWCDIVDKEPKLKYTKRLPGGTVLDFDLHLGQWVVGDDVERSVNVPNVPDEENN